MKGGFTLQLRLKRLQDGPSFIQTTIIPSVSGDLPGDFLRGAIRGRGHGFELFPWRLLYPLSSQRLGRKFPSTGRIVARLGTRPSVRVGANPVGARALVRCRIYQTANVCQTTVGSSGMGTAGGAARTMFTTQTNTSSRVLAGFRTAFTPSPDLEMSPETAESAWWRLVGGGRPPIDGL